MVRTNVPDINSTALRVIANFGHLKNRFFAIYSVSQMAAAEVFASVGLQTAPRGRFVFTTLNLSDTR